MSSSSSSSSSPSSLNPISQLNAAYARYLLSNAGRVSRIESSLRSLTWLIPGATLSSEGLYTGLNIVSAYHDALLSEYSTTSSSSPSSSSASSTSISLPASPHARYTRWWLKQSKMYKTVARLLSLVGYCQLLAEMAGKKYRGDKGRWRVVIALESIKAVLRLILLRLTAQRTILQPSIPEREVDPSSQSSSTSSSSGSLSLSLSETSIPDTWKASRTGFEIPTIASIRASASPSSNAAGGAARVESEIAAFLQTKVLTIDSVRKPYDLVRRRRGVGVVAETVWILRPLIYVLALKRYGKKHWYPFLLSLACEYFAYQNMADSLSSSSSSGRRGASTEVEKQELAKRRKAFWLYFLRGPLYYGWTREKIESFTNRFGGIFGLGLVANIADDYKHLIDEYYYYSST